MRMHKEIFRVYCLANAPFSLRFLLFERKHSKTEVARSHSFSSLRLTKIDETLLTVVINRLAVLTSPCLFFNLIHSNNSKLSPASLFFSCGLDSFSCCKHRFAPGV